MTDVEYYNISIDLHEYIEQLEERFEHGKDYDKNDIIWAMDSVWGKTNELINKTFEDKQQRRLEKARKSHSTRFFVVLGWCYTTQPRKRCGIVERSGGAYKIVEEESADRAVRFFELDDAELERLNKAYGIPGHYRHSVILNKDGYDSFEDAKTAVSKADLKQEFRRVKAAEKPY